MSMPLKTSPGSDLLALLQELAQVGPKLMFELGPKLLSMSVETTRNFVDAATALATATLPKIEIPKLQTPCCDIPETECPPRCVCEIHWKTCQGSTLQATIQVTNTGSASRNFTFSATVFSGPGNPQTKLQLSTQSANLKPHESVNLTATLAVTPDFQAGGQYVAEVLVHGAYQQCVRVNLDIASATAIVDCTPKRCEVKAGDLPVRIRAHRWYDHFQCTEPCTELLPGSPDAGHR